MAMSSRNASEGESLPVTQPRYEDIPFSLVDTDPDQPRQDFSDDDIADLARSIEENTLLQAITVKANPAKPGRYIVVAGERRLRALKLLGRTEDRFRVLEGIDAKRSYRLSAVENLQRVNMNPIEEALCYRRLHDEERLTWEEVRNLTGRDLTVILDKVKLLELPQEIIDMVRKGNLPQVTALNLAQWKNDKGDYLRMAHDLVNGRKPTELGFKPDSALRVTHVTARLPKTPAEFGERIVTLSGKVQSMPTVLEAFLGLSPEDKKKVFASINPSVLGKIRIRIKSLALSVQAFSEELDRTKEGTTRERPKPVPVVAKAPPVRPPLPPPPPPTPPRPRREVQASEGNDEEPTQPKGFVDQQPLELTRFVWIVLFTTMIGERRTANLSKERLVRELRGCKAYNGQPIEQVVYNTIMSAKHRWRKPVSGNEDNQDMARRMHVFCRETGNLPEFEDALDAIVATDISRDPVELPTF